MRPPRDARPAPHIRPAEPANGSREVSAARENGNTRTGDPKPVSDVGRDHKLSARVNVHGKNRSPILRTPRRDSMVGVVRCGRTATPQTDVPCTRLEGKPNEEAGVAPASVVVEI